MNPQSTNAVEVFYSYAHEDEKLRDELQKHLANLKRQGVITDWYDRNISAGKEWDDEIRLRLDTASVILLLISPDFMSSDYINDVEVKRAMERHEAGEARVIPIILRPVDWTGAPFSKLEGLPTDVTPITSWADPDEAFLDVTKGIRKAVAELSGPSASVPTLPNIPRPPKVGFVSRRDKEGHDIVERLRVELAPQRNQLVALWGPGGVGKTTLAAEAVRSLSETSGQRLVWITADARPNFAFSTLLDEIAEQLGRADLRPLALEQKVEALRVVIATAPTLIILDNLETIPPEEEMLCKTFLAKRAQCPALITTRERIEDAYLLPLAAMKPEEAAEFLKRLIAQSPDAEIYAVVDRERILQTAEYNPLIIRWIVAQIDLAQDPEEVLSDLAHGEGDAAARVFDRSFNLPQMAQGGRAVLLALSLFVPSASRKALAEVAGLDKEKDRKRFKGAVKTLSSLWLLRTVGGGERLAVQGLTRQLTEAHLTRDPRAKTFRERYVARFSRYALAYAQPTPANFDALETERDNLLSAMEVAFDLQSWSTVVRLMDAMSFDGVNGFLLTRGYWDEAIRRGEQALKAARSLSEDLKISRFAHNLAITYQGRGEIAQARSLYLESLQIEKRLGSQVGIASSLHQLATLAQDQGELEEARRLCNESFEIAKKLGDQRGIASTLHQLGMLAQVEGHPSEARRLYNESLTIEKEFGNPAGIATSLHQLATLAHEQGDSKEADHLSNESLEIARKLGDRSGISSNLHQLGISAQAKGKLDEAYILYNESLDISKSLGNQGSIARALHNLATIAAARGERDEARQQFKQSLEIAKRVGNQENIALTLTQLGRLAEDDGENAEAGRLFGEAIAIFEKLKSPYAESAQRGLERVKGKSS